MFEIIARLPLIISPIRPSCHLLLLLSPPLLTLKSNVIQQNWLVTIQTRKIHQETKFGTLKNPCSVYLLIIFWFNGKIINKIFQYSIHDFQWAIFEIIAFPWIIAPFSAITRGNTYQEKWPTSPFRSFCGNIHCLPCPEKMAIKNRTLWDYFEKEWQAAKFSFLTWVLTQFLI